MLLLITDIEWDTEGETIEECCLPKTVVALDIPTTNADYLNNEISEALSDEFGFCHNGYQTTVVDNGEAGNSLKPTHAGGGFFPERLALMIAPESNDYPAETTAFGFGIDDVLAVRPKLEREQAQKVLDELLRKGDASIGVSFETIEMFADELFPNK